MKRDKLFGIEIYEEGTIFDCSQSGFGVNKNRLHNRMGRDTLLFTEKRQPVPFGVQRKEEIDMPDTDELILLQLSYW